MKIKDIPKEFRPRERLKLRGKENLSDVELLSIILKAGTKEKSVEDLSIELLNIYKLSDLKEIEINELTKIKGLGEVKAIELIASIELGKRIFMKKPTLLKKLTTPEDIYNETKYLFDNLKQEYFYSLYLNTKNELIEAKLLFVGTIDRSTIHPREIFKEAYKVSASYIIIIHNHPSNDVTPSKADDFITNSIVKIGKIQGIPVLDHIIVSSSNYYSYYDNNKII